MIGKVRTLTVGEGIKGYMLSCKPTSDQHKVYDRRNATDQLEGRAD
jgi:hypothetical protein